MTERMVEEATLTKAKSLANRSKNGSPDLATPTRDPSGSRTSEGQLLYRHQGVMSNAGLNTPTEEVSAPPPDSAAPHVSHDGSADVPKELPEAADLNLISEVQEAPKGSRRLRWLLVFDDVFALCCAWPLAVLLTRTSSTDVFSRSEGGFLPIIWCSGCFPMPLICPIHCIFKIRHKPVILADNRAAAMIKMEVRKQYIRNIIFSKTMCGK